MLAVQRRGREADGPQQGGALSSRGRRQGVPSEDVRPAASQRPLGHEGTPCRPGRAAVPRYPPPMSRLYLRGPPLSSNTDSPSLVRLSRLPQRVGALQLLARPTSRTLLREPEAGDLRPPAAGRLCASHVPTLPPPPAPPPCQGAAQRAGVQTGAAAVPVEPVSLNQNKEFWFVVQKQQ